MSIRNALLALLSDGPRYGFQLKKEFETYTGDFWPLNVGQVYTTLSRLQRDGLVAEHAAETPDRDSEDPQRSFELTATGSEELLRWFATPRESNRFERDELTIKVALAIAIDHPDTLEVIYEQRSEAVAVLQTLTRQKATADPADICAAVTMDAAITRVDAEIRWLELTAERLRAGDRQPAPRPKQLRAKQPQEQNGSDRG